MTDNQFCNCYVLKDELTLSEDGEFISGVVVVDGEQFPFDYDLIAEEYEIDNFGMPLPEVFENDVYGLIDLEINDAILEFCTLSDQEKELLILGMDMGNWYDEIQDDEESLALYQKVEQKAQRLADQKGISLEEYLDNILSEEISHNEEER